LSIYTKKGDKGYTTNVLGHTYSKSDIMMELQGSIDEINANIGYLRSLLSSAEIKEVDTFLKDIQFQLFALGVELSSEFTIKKITSEHTKVLEIQIDRMTQKTGELKNFIYQSGTTAASYSHVIRTVVRRTERIFVAVLKTMNCFESYQYINRLSDYFFTLARYFNHLNGIQEEILKL
jgi:cob(I)alamin adenosyltransferase